MNESERMHLQKEEHEQHKDHHKQSPYWKRAHHDWRFWFIVLLMLVGIIYYTLSDNFVLAPRNQTQQSTENSRVP